MSKIYYTFNSGEALNKSEFEEAFKVIGDSVDYFNKLSKLNQKKTEISGMKGFFIQQLNVTVNNLREYLSSRYDEDDEALFTLSLFSS